VANLVPLYGLTRETKTSNPITRNHFENTILKKNRSLRRSSKKSNMGIVIFNIDPNVPALVRYLTSWTVHVISNGIEMTKKLNILLLILSFPTNIFSSWKAIRRDKI
jgi:hypothetical protein